MDQFDEKSSIFYGKFLLFGEYTVILGSNSLALPLKMFTAHWKFGNTSDEHKDAMFNLSKYLKDLDLGFDHLHFEAHISKGLFFHSDIPFGYGCGSSGSLIAAIYKDYFSTHEKEDLTELQKKLGLMESFFHGKSSGIDPLVIYQNQAILSANGFSKAVIINKEAEVAKNWFLVDTGISRSTAPLVNRFLDLVDHYDLAKQINLLKEENNKAITAFLKNEASELQVSLRRISELELIVLQEMIPEEMKELWKIGLESSDYTMKLCGAGGGGFFLLHGKPIKNALPLNF